MESGGKWARRLTLELPPGSLSRPLAARNWFLTQLHFCSLLFVNLFVVNYQIAIMSYGSALVSPVSTLRGGREVWKVVVRVLPMWESAPIGDPSNPYALHFHLIWLDVDEQKLWSYLSIWSYCRYPDNCFWQSWAW